MVNLFVRKVVFTLLAIAIICGTKAIAQTDTLAFANDEFVIGEIKKMERGVISIETSYSDKDFAIDWTAVTAINSAQNYLITLDDGRRFISTINTTADNIVELKSEFAAPIRASLLQVVELRPVNDTFWDNLSTSIDMGYNLTRANNLRQFNTRIYIGYSTRKWEINGSYNTVFSHQDSIQDTRRTDANITGIIFLPHDWFLSASNSFLSNDEQLLNLRSTTKAGVGNYLIHSNYLYFAVLGGVAMNNEIFTDDTPDRSSGEGVLGVEYNMFNTGDLSLVTSAIGYPSITARGRFRVDFKFDIKYDLPLDFYIKAGTTLNYDNQPVAGASDLDYVIQTGIGWEW